MSRFFSFIHNTPEGTSSYTTSSTVIDIYVSSNIELSSLTILNVKKSSSSGSPINLTCTINGVTYTGDEQITYDEYKNIIFNFEEPILFNTNSHFTITIKASSSFNLQDGRAKTVDTTGYLNQGIYFYYTSNSYPSFGMTYSILDEPLYIDSETNEGYPYFRELENNFSDYTGESKFLQDKNLTINEGYPYLQSLTTTFSDIREIGHYLSQDSINEGYPYLTGLDYNWSNYIVPVKPIAKAIFHYEQDTNNKLVLRKKNSKIAFYINE